MAPRLWWLDKKTSRWRDMGEMRPVKPNITRNRRELSSERRFYVGEIQTDRISVVNIDIPWRRCYVRAEVSAISKGGHEPMGGATITLIGQEDEDQYYGYTTAVTNQNGVACLPAWCDSSVYLQANKYNYDFIESGNFSRNVHYLSPDNVTLHTLAPELKASILEGDETNSFHFTVEVSSPDGPIFPGEKYHKCLSTVDSARAFRFYSIKKEEAEEFSDFGSRPHGHPLSWYTTDSKLPEKQTRKCFVKISTEFDRHQRSPPLLSVESYTSDRKQRYGFSIKQQTRTKEKAEFQEYYDMYGTCVEYRCSEHGKETFIVVSALTNWCPDFYLNASLLIVQPRRWDESPYRPLETYLNTSFYAPAEVSDGKLGLYTGFGDTAEEQCRQGREGGAGDMTSAGYAVLMRDNGECPYEWWEN